MKLVAELYAKRQISDALNQRNRLNVEEKLDMAIRDKVLVQRENKGWAGPYTLLLINGNTYNIDLPSRTTSFQITLVKKYYIDYNQNNELTPIPVQPEL